MGHSSRRPLVSCIMPTGNRPAFAVSAVDYFLRQDYPNRELIIVDDGHRSVETVVPHHPRIRVIRRDFPLTVGAKRNLACEEAQGEVIVHWDDDDWMAPTRISRQVKALMRGRADVCGVGHLLFYDPRRDKGWTYSYPGTAERRWLAGTSLCYWRAWWAGRHFLALDVGEDSEFLRRRPRPRMQALRGDPFLVAIIHDENQTRPGPHWSWQPVPGARIRRLLGDDCSFYDALTTGPPCLPASDEISYPLVTCIMPTRNRRRFVPQAIRYFQRQDYPHRELIIVDDGDEPVADLVPDDPSIRYVHLERPATTGFKRNLACSLARGSCIAMWDDDDWYAANRLSYQMAPLRRGTADVSGLAETLLLSVEDNRCWSCSNALQEKMFLLGVVGGTIVFRRTVWEQGRHFPAASLGEDGHFLTRIVADGARLAKLPNQNIFVYIRHGQNSWDFEPGRYLDQSGWQHREPFTFLPAEDSLFYGVHEDAPEPARAPAASADRQPLVSCIVATGTRPHFLAQLIRYFRRLTYPHRELIIVDDGLAPLPSLIPDDKHIHYHYLDEPATLGRKLNVAVERAHGGLIQKMDDDDYYAPGFLAATVRAVLAHDGDDAIAAYDSFLVLLADSGRLVYSGNGWCAGGTLCFRRKLWEKRAFREDVHGREDWWFLKDHGRQQLKIHEPELYIYVRHNLDHLWKRIGDQDVDDYFLRQPPYRKSLAGCVEDEDLPFYRRMRVAIPTQKELLTP